MKLWTVSIKKATACAVFFGLVFSSMVGATHAADMIVNADTSLEWNQNEGYYKALGNAHAYQGEQEIFADDLRAFYDPASSRQDISQILADGNVRFSDTRHTGSGTRLVYQAQSKSYILSGPNARIDGPDGLATAQKEIHFQRAKGTISLLESAKIKLEDGRQLFGDKVELLLDEAENIKQITAHGNVSVKQASGSTAIADKMVYNRAGDTAILQGNVTVIDGSNKLSGDKAEIDFNTGVSRMLSTKTGGRVSGRFTGTKQ